MADPRAHRLATAFGALLADAQHALAAAEHGDFGPLRAFCIVLDDAAIRAHAGGDGGTPAEVLAALINEQLEVLCG